MVRIPKKFRTPPPDQQTFFDDFETEPIGHGNPYHRCIHCKRSVPEINYRLEGHLRSCLYRQAKESGQPYPIPEED